MLWKGFQRPKRLEVERETLTDGSARFYAQPFERGFGTTIGNALRRVLLSSIEGAAVTAVKIEGVLHEFSPIPGVVEDATDIILNLKQIPFKLHGDGTEDAVPARRQAGRGHVRDIEADADVEILDRTRHIATVSEGGKLDMEMRLKRGRGYVSADKNFDEDLGIGFIPIDSVHSPVRRCNYTVEAARLGQITDYDKLTLEVWTNGSVHPRDAVSLAAKLLRDHMNIFINFEEELEQPQVARRRASRSAHSTRTSTSPSKSWSFRCAVLQLPEEREHPDHRRAGAEDRSRDAQDQELRPQVAERDQGDPALDGPQPRHAARSADRGRNRARRVRRSEPESGRRMRHHAPQSCTS